MTTDIELTSDLKSPVVSTAVNIQGATIESTLVTGGTGTPGEPGQDGVDGADGRDIELQNNGTHIQWRAVGDAEWQDLILVASLQGFNGQDGTDGLDGAQTELQVVDQVIQYRFGAEEPWTNLVDLSPYTTATELSTALAGYATTADVTAAVNGKAESTHTHPQSDVTGLIASLSGKADATHTHTKADVTDFAHTHDDRYYTEAETDALIAGVTGGAPAVHTHVEADITDLGDYATNLELTTGLATKADTASLATVATSGDYVDLINKPAPFDPGTLATVATTGAYSDLTGTPTLGTAAASATTDFATAAQGTTADSAVQPADLAPYALSADVTTGLASKSDTSHTHTLDGLSDATITTPAAGDVLTYDDVTSAWINAVPTGGGGGGGPSAFSITVHATDGDYATLGEAIAAATAYQTIIVKPGTYTESAISVGVANLMIIAYGATLNFTTNNFVATPNTVYIKGGYWSFTTGNMQLTQAELENSTVTRSEAGTANNVYTVEAAGRLALRSCALSCNNARLLKLVSATASNIDSCTLSANGSSGTYGVNPFSFTGDSIHFTNNYITSGGGGNITSHLLSCTGARFIFAHNTIYTTSGNNSSGIYTTGQHTKITNNSIINTNSLYAIYASGTDTVISGNTVNGIVILMGQRTVFSGNTTYMTFASQTAVQYGTNYLTISGNSINVQQNTAYAIGPQSTSTYNNITITGNFLKVVGGYASILARNMQYSTISGNTIEAGANAGTEALALYGTCNHLNVANNTIRCTATTSGYGISILPYSSQTPDNLFIHGNIVTGFANGFSIAGTANATNIGRLILHGNAIRGNTTAIVNPSSLTYVDTDNVIA